MAARVRPDLFVIGAPKCGTTSLWRLLRDHPRCFLCEPKEPSFFASFLRSRPVETLRDCERLFRDADPERHAVVGEASVLDYLSDDTIEAIRRYSPGAKFVYMVRDPVELVVSFHAQLLRNGEEDLRDLGAAWDAQERRRTGRGIPLGCLDPLHLQYRTVASVGTRALALRRRIPPDRLLILHLDDLRGMPGPTLARLGRFLGLDDLADRRLPHENAGGLPRFPAVQAAFNVVRRQPVPLARMPGVPGLGLGARLQRWNTTRRRPHDHVAPAVLERLAAELAAERRIVASLRLRPETLAASA